MILDQPLLASKRSTRIPIALIIELVLASNILIFVVIRDAVGDINLHITIAYPALALCCWYIVAYYWIDKPTIRTAKTIAFSILYGITLSLMTATAYALVTFRQFTLELTIISFIVVALIPFLDIGLGKRQSRVMKKGTSTRIVTLGLIIGFLYLIPEHHRILFTFRKYPAFVKYYSEHYEEKPFPAVVRDFMRKYDKLDRVE